jgi:hypothetical protein
MSDFQEMIEKGAWDAQCIDEGYDILKSYSRALSRRMIASLTIGDTITFATGRTRGNLPSMVAGEIVSIGRTRVKVQEQGHIRKWTIPVWGIIDHEGVDE